MDEPRRLTADDLKAVVGGYRVSAAVAAMASLGVAEALADGPRTTEDLAQELSVVAGPLRRVLRLLAATGALAEEGEDCFGPTELSAALTEPGMRDMLLGWAAMPQIVAAWSALGDGLRTGRPPFELAHGTSFHRYLATHSAAGAAYTAAMSSTVDGFQLMADAIDVGPSATVAAIGGGVGIELVPFLRDHPGRRGIVMDLPSALIGAELVLGELGLLDRVEVVDGDARVDVPPADAYVLSTVLRCMPDEDAIAVLTACRRSANPGGRVHLMEPVIPPGPAGLVSATMDLTAWVVYGANDRTEQRWRELHEAAGLELLSVDLRDDVFSVLTSAPAALAVAAE